MTVGAVDCGSGGRLQHVCGLGVDWCGRSRLPRCVAPSAAGCPRYPSLATGARGGFEGSRVGESAVYWVAASCCVRLPSLRPCNAATPELGWRCCMSVLLCSQCPDALASGRQMEWCYPPVHWGRGRVGQPCAAESGGLPMRGRLIDTIRYDTVARAGNEDAGVGRSWRGKARVVSPTRGDARQSSPGSALGLAAGRHGGVQEGGKKKTCNATNPNSYSRFPRSGAAAAWKLF